MCSSVHRFVICFWNIDRCTCLDDHGGGQVYSEWDTKVSVHTCNLEGSLCLLCRLLMFLMICISYSDCESVVSLGLSCQILWLYLVKWCSLMLGAHWRFWLQLEVVRSVSIYFWHQCLLIWKRTFCGVLLLWKFPNSNPSSKPLARMVVLRGERWYLMPSVSMCSNRFQSGCCLNNLCNILENLNSEPYRSEELPSFCKAAHKSLWRWISIQLCSAASGVALNLKADLFSGGIGTVSLYLITVSESTCHSSLVSVSSLCVIFGVIHYCYKGNVVNLLEVDRKSVV